MVVGFGRQPRFERAVSACGVEASSSAAGPADLGLCPSSGDKAARISRASSVRPQP
jgi:hypothetical protein